MSNFKKASVFRNFILNQQKEFSNYLRGIDKNIPLIKHNPLYYPEAYAEKYQTFSYKKEFILKNKLYKNFDKFLFSLLVFAKSELRFFSRFIELLILPFISIIFKHKNNKNRFIKTIYTVYSTPNQTSPRELIKYFVPKGFLKLNEQIFIEAFDETNLISAYFKSRRLCKNKNTISTFSSNGIFLSISGIFLIIYQYLYIKYIFIKLLYSKPNFLYLFFASHSKLWNCSHFISLLQGIRFLNTLNNFSTKETKIILWWEGHFHNWCSLNNLERSKNIQIYWPNSPSNSSYPNLSLIPGDNIKISSVNKVTNLYSQKKIIIPNLNLENKVNDKASYFRNKNVFIATGHSFDEIEDCKVLYDNFRKNKIRVTARIHPHFLKNNLEKIIKYFPEIYNSHNSTKSTKSEIIKSDVILTTLDSIAFLASSNKKFLLPIISPKYITYMNILEFNPNIIFIDLDKKIYIERFEYY